LIGDIDDVAVQLGLAVGLSKARGQVDDPGIDAAKAIRNIGDPNAAVVTDGTVRLVDAVGNECARRGERAADTKQRKDGDRKCFRPVIP
jgi:hypothetical protein